MFDAIGVPAKENADEGATAQRYGTVNHSVNFDFGLDLFCIPDRYV